MKFLITHTFRVRSPAGELLPVPELHDEGERLMGALLDLEERAGDIADAATSTDADGGVVAVELLVTAPTREAALDHCRAVVHSMAGPDVVYTATP